MSKKSFIIYGILLLLAALLAWWVFYDPDPLKELKQMETVTAGTEEVISVVNKALKAVEKKIPGHWHHVCSTAETVPKWK